MRTRVNFCFRCFLAPSWARRRIYGIYQPKLLPLFSCRWVNCARLLKVPRLARQKPILWWTNLLWKVEVLEVQINSFLFCVKLGARESLPAYIALHQRQGLWWGDVLNLLTSFGESGFMVSWGSDSFPLISDFSERIFVHKFLVN